MQAPFGLRALAVVSGLGLAASGAAGQASGASSAVRAQVVRVRVVGIARNGQQVKVAFARIAGPNGSANIFGGHAVSLRPGLYWVGAEVDTPGPKLSETLVLRRMTIRRSETVRLDARPGTLVRFGLNVPEATDQEDLVAACLRGGFFRLSLGAGGQPGTVYVVPVRSPIITFGYGSFWQGPAAGYLMAGHRSGAIPSTPTFRGALSAMAKLTLEFRQGASMNSSYSLIMKSHAPCGTGWFAAGPNASSGSAFTDYVTAGPWATQILGHPAEWSGSLRLAAERSYTKLFGAAVWGPSIQYSPQSEGDGVGRILFYPAAPFADPNQPNGLYCCDKSSITLAFGGHVLKRETLISTSGRLFNAHASRAGWYTLAIKSWRWVPSVIIPKNLLSRTETVTWRFHAAPLSTPSGQQRELPVRVARIAPLGLNIDNQAAPNGVTPLRIQLVEPHGRGFPRAPQYQVRTVRMLASFDGGRTWQALSLTGHGDDWLGTVHDPASGFVALRSIVTDSRGDLSKQTIYQAYAIG